MKWLIAVVAASLAVSAVAAPAAPPSWQHDITMPDRRRLGKLWEAWTRSLNEIQQAGQGKALVALGPIGVPDAATMHAEPGAAIKPVGPLPGVGDYRCRTINLGQRAGGAAASPAPIASGGLQPCRIEMRGKTLWFEQASGVQRLGGRLYADGNRQLFLGTLALVGEMAIMPYGVDPQRDAIGVLRSIGPQHWRMELPWPNWQSNLAIVEMVPA
ncbi:MAG: DUF4893 domain-containing protein [Sandarakinorhabdus sp.]|nr:DUF4893 domain-containing protein [Sandarakinorhabdus sp.]